MTDNAETIIVEKNRQRAFWALAIVAFATLVSIALIVTGLLGKEGILWGAVSLGTVGLLGFGASAVMVIRTMRSPWHLALDPGRLTLHTPTYILAVSWENVAGIVVAEVNRRLGCALLFEEPGTVAQETKFLYRSNRPEIVSDAETMLARMEENYTNLGYHLGIPGRILEKGPEELAEILTRARTGKLWRKEE